MQSAKEFIRSVVYAGESSENYVDTRVRIYKNLKRKTSMAMWLLRGHTCKHLHLYVVASKTFKLLIQKDLGRN